MIRKTLFAVAAVAAAVLMMVAGLPAGIVAQETDTGDETAEEAVAVESLALGERYEGSAWDVAAHDVFVTEGDRVGWSEVRIALSLRNTSAAAIPYSSTAFFDGAGYPRLELVDAFDVTRTYRMVRLGQDAVPSSNVTLIPPGLTGRWTVGFEVPTVNVAFLRLRLIEPLLGTVAEWDLTTAATLVDWAPPALETVAVGDTVPWGDDGLIVRPAQYGSLVCGDPDNQLVTHVFALQLDVTNANFTDDVAFPGVRLPDTAAVAQWADGSTAQMSYETYGGEVETLRKFAADLVFIPPTDGEFFPRGLLFGVTKDSRVGDVDDGPHGVQLNRPDGTSIWLELDGPGELAVNPRFCDLGLFDGPLSLAYAPAGDLDVGRRDVVIATDDEINQQTADSIVQAVIVLGQVSIDVDGDFTGLTAADLNDVWPQLNFVDGLTLASPGVIGTEIVSPTQVLLMTLSPIGRYYCAGFDLEAPTKLANGEDFDSTLNGCLPEDKTAEEEDPEGGDSGDSGATTTTTTVPEP